MDFKSLIGKLDSIEAPEKTPQAPTLPKSAQLNEDAQMRVLAGQTTVLAEAELMEKAVSKSQQKAAGAALAAKRGDGKAVGASKDMMKMSTKELEKIAGTKHKGLPEKKSETKAKTTKESVELDIEEFNDKFSTMVEAAKKAPAKKPAVKKTDEKVAEGNDELRGRLGTNAINKKPRSGQSDFRNIPAGNHPGSQNKFSDLARKGQPDQLKTAIKKSLGKHPTPNLPESAKPDFLDVDKDGDKKEPMKKAVADKKKGSVGKTDEKVAEGKSAAQKAAQEKFKAMVGKKKGDTKEEQVSEMFPGDGEYEKKYGSPIADLDSKFDKKKTGPNRTMYTRKHKAEPESDNKKRPVKESVERKMSFKQMMMLVVESGGQQQIDPTDQTLFSWAQRIAKSKLGEGMKAEVYAGMVYERMGGRFDMYDVLSETKK
jgi:hypothetical protein